MIKHLFVCVLVLDYILIDRTERLSRLKDLWKRNVQGFMPWFIISNGVSEKESSLLMNCVSAADNILQMS